MHKFLNNTKKYSYTLLDSHFKADNFTKGRAFKSFFDNFCQNIFEANLTMLENIDYFPIAYNENNAYASIAHALHSLTPFVSSEENISYKDKKAQTKQDKDKTDDKEKWRFVDFWCMNEKREFEIWIEVKRLWLKISKNAKWDFDNVAIERIKNALWQIYNIKDANPYQTAKDTNFKVAFFTIPLSCAISQIPSEKDIETAPKFLADLLVSFIDNRRNMGVLCAVLDLDPQGTRKGGIIYKNEYTPYFALGAIVLE